MVHSIRSGKTKRSFSFLWNEFTIPFLPQFHHTISYLKILFDEKQGTLADGRVIAVKQLSIASQHGRSQFVAEIATISAVQHRNLVKLYGCCIDGEKRLLVYEYLENKSLDQALFGIKTYIFLDIKYEVLKKYNAIMLHLGFMM